MPSIALDSGPAYALFARRDRHHERAKVFLQGLRANTLVTTIPVIVEVAYMLHPRADRFLDWVVQAATIDDALVADIPRLRDFMKKFEDIGPDLADASLVAMCERRGISAIATVDGDFLHYRMADGRGFDMAF